MSRRDDRDSFSYRTSADVTATRTHDVTPVTRQSDASDYAPLSRDSNKAARTRCDANSYSRHSGSSYASRCDDRLVGRDSDEDGVTLRDAGRNFVTRDETLRDGNGHAANNIVGYESCR